MAAALWGVAATLPAIRTLAPSTVLLLDPIAIDYATVTAAMASLLLALAVTARLTYLRRLELDVADRVRATLIVASVALLATLPALLLDVLAPDRAVPFVVVLSSLFYVWAASASDARRVASSLRGGLAIIAFLAPAVLLLAVLSQRAPRMAPQLIVLASALSVLLGLIAARLSRPLAPEQSRWLDAIAIASEAALVPNPDDALRETLVALGPTAPGPASRVELWQLDPPKILHVDVAGQLHEEAALVPASVLSLAEREPERTLRADVLTSVQIRNVTAREALAYFDHRRTFSATLLTSETEPLGLLALPKSHRKSPLSLEECTALRRLCDRLESVMTITSAQARARQREILALNKVAELEAENSRLKNVLLSTGARQKRYVERYAQKLRPQLYSPSSRTTRLELQRLAKSSQELAILLPAGTDALGWASLVHLESPRHLGPFVTFDCSTSDFEQELWDDPERSPLAMADTGTWVLINPQALPMEQQEVLVNALVRAKANRVIDATSPTGLVIVTHLGKNASFDELPISPSLKGLVRENCRIRVPSLQERPEDLRATLYERAARLGTTLLGRPLGVEPRALAELLEHEWPLNDLELEETILSLVLVSRGETITAEDLQQIGFYGAIKNRAQDDDAHADLEPSPRRRIRTTTVGPKSRHR